RFFFCSSGALRVLHSFPTRRSSDLKAMQILERLNELEGIDFTYTSIGSGLIGSVTAGEIYVKLVPRNERSLTQAELMVEARKRPGNILGVDIAVLDASGIGGARAPLAVEVRGPDVRELQRVADDVARVVAGIPGIVDVQSSMGDPRPEFRIEVNREVAREVGLDVAQIAMTVQPLLAGQTATRWEDPSGEEREVVVQIDPAQRVSVQDLETLPVATMLRGENGEAMMVPLGQVARIELGEAPAQIDRKDLQRIATVSANTEPWLSISEASSLIQQELAKMDLPPGYSVH